MLTRTDMNTDSNREAKKEKTAGAQGAQSSRKGRATAGKWLW
jgi:hypothetical protein